MTEAQRKTHPFISNGSTTSETLGIKAAIRSQNRDQINLMAKIFQQFRVQSNEASTKSSDGTNENSRRNGGSKYLSQN